jgi:hypothetical protein
MYYNNKMNRQYFICIAFLINITIYSCATFVSGYGNVSLTNEEKYYNNANINNKKIFVLSNVSQDNSNAVWNININNKKIEQYIIREMKINSNNIAQPNDPSAINIIVKGNISTHSDFFDKEKSKYMYLPFLIPIFPIQKSSIKLEVIIFYKRHLLLSVQLWEELETHSWVIPVLPIFAKNYQKIIAKELSKKIISSMNKKDIYKIIKSIDENNYDSGT